MLFGKSQLGDAPLGGDDLDRDVPIESASFSIVTRFVDPNEAVEALCFRVTVSFVDPNEALETLTFRISVDTLDPFETKLAPKDFWSGYSCDGTGITIPIATLSGISASEADAVTGDWRKIMQAFLVGLDTHLNGLGTFHKIQTVRTASFEDWNHPKTEGDSTLKRTIRAHFTRKFGAPHVTAEPGV